MDKTLRLGVFGRFLTMAISACMVAFVLGILLFLWSGYREAQDDLKEKLDSLSGVYALILAEPLANERYDQIELYAVGLLVDKEVAGFLITDLQGQEIMGFGDTNTNLSFAKTTTVRFADEAGVRKVGKIRLVMTMSSVDQFVSQQIRVMVLMLGGLFVAVLVCSGWAYWRTVGIPLQHLTSEIRRFQKDGIHTDVEVHTDDQLGEVIQEYNRMQHLSLRQREKLLEHQHGLEEEVSHKAEKLKQELESHSQTSERLAYIASHDSLTELPNRRAFQEHVSMWMVNLAETKDYGSVCFIDLDRFKSVNDSSGYNAGDAFLVSVSKLLELSIGATGYLARLGGDEFALFLQSMDSKDVAQYCGALVEKVSQHEFVWEGQSFKVGLSIGIYTVDQGYSSYDDALKNAALACDTAKASGGNCLHLYSEPE